VSTRARVLLAAAALAVPLAAAVPLALPAAAAGAAGPGGAASQCNVAGLARVRTPVQLTFWESMPEQNGVTLTALTNAFNASQRTVHVNLVDQSSYQDTWTKVQSALTTGDLPDITQLEDEYQQGAIDSKAFLPVQTCMRAARYSTSDFLPRVLDYFKVQGVQVGMPFNISAPVTYYNQQSFTKAGLDPATPPATMSAYLADAAKLKAVGLGTGMVLDPWFAEAWLATQGQLFVNHQNGRAGRASAAVFDTAAGRKVFATLSTLVRTDGAVTNPVDGPDEYDYLLGIGSGKYGMTFGYSASLGSIEALLPNYPNVTLGVGPFPTITGAKPGGIPVTGAGLYISAKDTPIRRAAAWEYISYLDSTASQATWAAGTGYLPIRKSSAQTATVQKLWATSPGYKVGYEELTQGASTPASSGAVIGAFGQVQADMTDALQRMFQNGTPPPKAVAAAARSVTQTMQSYNSRL